MSLLMDALKKAEEEKKRAAKRLQEVEMESRDITNESNINTTNENEIVNDEQTVAEESPVPELYTNTAQFSLEPLSLVDRSDGDDNKPDTVDTSVDENAEWEVATVDASEAFSEELTLENTISEGTDSQQTFEETQKNIDLNDTTIIEGLSTENASAPFDDTFHGVLFEEPEQETDLYEETLPGVPADQLAKDLGGGRFQPTPVAAKTVFSAGRPVKKKNSFKWGVLVVLAILATGSFAIFYYFTITPVSRSLPSPLVARGIESSGVESAPILVPPVIEHPAEYAPVNETLVSSVIEEAQTELVEKTFEQDATVMVNTDEQGDVEQIDTELVVTESTVEEIDIANVDANVIENKTDKTVTEEEIITDASIEKESKTLAVDKPTEDVISQRSVQADASLISISKSKNQLKDNVMVSQAFKAYQDGHYDAAKSIYQTVLKSDPDNRDAHLGLAAIAISNLDRKSAYSHYVHLLELDPADTIAMNALIGLSNSADPVKDESAIKLLIQREGDVPYLYFSLGNLYAKQQRWANAQQSFFDAYRLDTTNSDYVLNLAISLDHMGQYDSALDFYKTAIDLFAQNASARFDPVPVNKRILVLSKLTEPKL